MLRLTLIAIFLQTFVLSLLPSATFAEDREARYERQAREMSADLKQLRQQLEGVPPESWEDAQIEHYFTDAIWIVFFGIMQYKQEHEALPSDIKTLRNSGHVEDWPDNPFNDWKPMNVKTDSTFSAGDFHFQVSPPSAYSRLKNPRPLSFQLSVFAPHENYPIDGRPIAMTGNDWAVFPERIFLTLGVHTEPTSSLRKKFEKLMKAREEAAQAEGGAKE